MTNQFIQSNTNFETLLETWETNVQDFLTFVIKACGVEQESETFQFLHSNVTNEKELNAWVNVFDGDLDNVVGVTEAYKALVH
ncbi:hypothetical protein [Paenibacillus sp. sgz302251]|uniref:hypothetical protein n=1 Tax=Paenibacillus sp. sgz302251 TaxID=3414493 RepID=UPI003C7A5577